MEQIIREEAMTITASIMDMAENLHLLGFAVNEDRAVGTIETFERIMDFDYEAVGFILEDIGNAIANYFDDDEDLTTALEDLKDELNGFYLAYADYFLIRPGVTIFL